MDRRKFVASAGSFGILASLGIPSPAGAAPIGPREDLETFSADPEKVAALRKAFRLLRDRGVDKPVGWFNYAAIHGVFANDADARGAALPLAAYWNQCHRDHTLFFVWHRAFLLAFERNLQALAGDPTLRLPYWDWYRNPGIPAIYRPERAEGAENPLFHRGRRDYVARGGIVWNPVSSGAIDEADFYGLQSTLDGNEHGRIHVNIGGDMAHPSTAARDPVFWIHHANVDRLLAAWLTRHQRVPDQAGAFDGAGYKFPIENAADLRPVAAMLDMGSTTPLGGYQSLDAPFGTPATTQTTRPAIIRRMAARTGSVEKGVLSLNAPVSVVIPAGGASLAFAVPRPADDKLKTLLDSAPLTQAGAVTIVLEDITIRNAPEGLSGFDVFANLPEGATGAAQRFKVGRISMFDLKVQHRHPGTDMTMPMPRTLRLPATSQVRAAVAARDVVVSFVADVAPGAEVAASTASISIGNARVEVTSAPTM